MTTLSFTKKVLETLPLPSGTKRIFFKDTRTPGLGVRVTSNGVKTFVVYRKVEGRPQRITLGRFPAVTVEQARTLAQKINGQIAGGRNPQAEKRKVRETSTLGDLFERYLNEYLIPHGKRTRQPKTYHRLYLMRWQAKKLTEISRSDVKGLHAKIGKSHGHVTANRLHQLLRAMFNWAIDEEIFPGENPAKGVKRFREWSRERFLQPDEMPRFFKALDDDPNETFRDFVLIALLTGARRANVQEMRWEQINLERATWEIPETKTGESHTIPLVPEAVSVLASRRANSGSEWVFPGKGKTGHIVEPKKAWRALLDRAGIQDLKIHDLRRTLGSWQAATGANLSVIGKTLSHKSVSTTAIYARINLKSVRKSVEQATSAILIAGGVGNGAAIIPLLGSKNVNSKH